jgi:ADP-ribose pyrophosphatase YjhB (NUDIX family)
MSSKPNNNPIFNVRVYGILIENDQLLVSDEIHHHRLITKFPGGGLQFGEGTTECLKREFMEELNIEIEITDHFYTVDFYQPSAFDSTQHVISINYRVSRISNHNIASSGEKLVHENRKDVQQLFRWVKTDQLGADEFTFPIDKKVAEMIAAVCRR